MARASGVTEIIVPIGGSPVRLVTPKQWRRAVRLGEIERSTQITREHRLTAASEEISATTMRADECPELQSMLDEILGPEPVVEVSTPELIEPEEKSAPPSPPLSSPSSTPSVSVPTTAPVTTSELQRNRDQVKAQLAALEERFAKNAPDQAVPLSGALTAPGSSAQPIALPVPPAPEPSPPPPPPPTLPQTDPTSSGGNLLRWLMMYPGAVIGSFLTWLLFVWVAGLLTFDLIILEAIAAFALGFLAVSLYAHIGMAIAPKKNRLSKWLLIAPYLPIWALMCLVIFISIGDGPILPEEFSSTVLFSLDELSPRWQLIWYGLGYAIGGFSIMKEPASSYE